MRLKIDAVVNSSKSTPGRWVKLRKGSDEGQNRVRNFGLAKQPFTTREEIAKGRELKIEDLYRI
jgi:hypothetical protein